MSYALRVFVSSACYELRDLRASLGDWLRNAGLIPVMSDEGGFPYEDNIPPYASCLRELESCPLVIAIVDRHYGKSFDDWGPYSQYKGCGPTHAEVLHALDQRKRVLLFVHDDIWNFYEMWRLNAKTLEQKLPHGLPVFELLATLPSLTDLESTEIQHHKAKALKRLGEASEASVLFEAVLNGPRPLHEARLQLIDIYRKHNANIPRVIELVDEIFALEPGANDVTYSVLLGTIERLPWGEGTWRGDLIHRHAAVIERTVIEAANVGVQQAYSAFAALGRFLSTEDPGMFFRIWSQLPEPAVDHLESDSERFAWGEIYFEASRLADADTPRLQLTALGLYESIGRPSGFHRQRLAELLIEMGRAKEGQVVGRF